MHQARRPRGQVMGRHLSRWRVAQVLIRRGAGIILRAIVPPVLICKGHELLSLWCKPAAKSILSSFLPAQHAELSDNAEGYRAVRTPSESESEALTHAVPLQTADLAFAPMGAFAPSDACQPHCPLIAGSSEQQDPLAWLACSGACLHACAGSEMWAALPDSALAGSCTWEARPSDQLRAAASHSSSLSEPL